MRSGYEMMCPGDKLRSSSAHDEAAENEVVEAGTSRQYGAELQTYRTMKCSACVVVGALMMGKLVASLRQRTVSSVCLYRRGTRKSSREIVRYRGNILTGVQLYERELLTQSPGYSTFESRVQRAAYKHCSTSSPAW